jgi:acyl carrier protein
MFNKEEIISQATIFLSGQLGLQADEIDINRELKSIGMDSFRIIELILFIERRTGLTLPDNAYTPANLKSLESIVHCFMKMQR